MVLLKTTAGLSSMAGLALALSVNAAAAQDQSTNRVAAKTDWSVFVEDNPTE